MTTYHEVLAFLVLVGAAWMGLTCLDWHRLLTRPQPVCCTGCGLSDAALRFAGDRCPPCRYREDQAEALRRDPAGARSTPRSPPAGGPRTKAAGSPRGCRFVKVGAVYRNHAGEPVYDGFAFQRPATAGDLVPAEITQTGRYPLGALICGWRPAELHALAHSQACTCLS